MLAPKAIPVISFVGYSGSGKTTLMTKIIANFKQKGYRVAAVKHDAHRFQMDVEGKDTWKFSQAGSDIVIINSAEKFAMIENLEKLITFDEIIGKIKNADIIFVEGYKYESPKKILLIRREKDLELLSLQGIIAVATSLSLNTTDVPVFDINDEKGITELIESIIMEEHNYVTRI